MTSFNETTKKGRTNHTGAAGSAEGNGVRGAPWQRKDKRGVIDRVIWKLQSERGIGAKGGSVERQGPCRKGQPQEGPKIY